MASSKEKSRTIRVRAKLSEENREGKEAGETSFRVLYYGANEVTVPFMWESQPGTPKHPIFTQNDNTLPPLTPPPSYTQTFSPSPTLGGSATPSRRTRKPRFFSAFFSSISRRANRHVSPMSSSNLHSGPLSWSTASSSSSPGSSPPRPGRSSTSCSSGPKSQSSLFDDDKKHEVGSSARDIMCFGYNKQGCYSMLNVKNSVVSIKGH